jgi:antitoxin (DNA-binding transcriptional repressor) of toxin-antitoxin stability system
MQVVNILRAKFTLSRLVKAIEQGQEREIIIARGGRPMAKLVPLENAPAGIRIGVAKGSFEVPDSIDTHNKEIAELFLGKANS